MFLVALYAGTLAHELLDAQGQLHVLSGLASSAAGGKLPDRMHLQQAKDSLWSLQGDARNAELHVGWLAWLGRPLQALPGAGQLEAGDALLRAGASAAAAGQDAIDGLTPVVDAVNQASGQTSVERAVMALAQGKPALTKAAAEMQAADDALAVVQVSAVPGRWRTAVQRAMDQEHRGSLDLQLAVQLPELLGVAAPKRYIIAAQNPADPRATGGYLGSWGIATVQAGRLVNLDYRGFNDWPGSGSGELLAGPRGGAFTSPPGWDRFEQAPNQFVPRDGWWAEDANWYPDFPTSARVMEAFSRLSEPAVDGVVAIDPYAAQALLTVTGPVRVPGYDEVISADNVIERVNYYEGRGVGAAPGRPAIEHGQKLFLPALTTVVLDRLRQLDASQLPKLAQALQSAAAGKHLLVALDDTTAAGLMQRLGWDGSVAAPAGDYLMLVDQNTTYVKIGDDIQRQLDYKLQLGQDFGGTADLRVTYLNSAPASDPRIGFTTDFRDYARLYVPLGAQLRDSSGFDGPVTAYQEAGHTVFGGDVFVAAGQTHVIELRYTLPAGVARPSGYQLMVQTQPGIPSLAFKATVAPPDGRPAMSLSRDLTADAQFDVPFSGSTSGAAAADHSLQGNRWDVVRQLPQVQAILAAAGGSQSGG